MSSLVGRLARLGWTRIGSPGIYRASSRAPRPAAWRHNPIGLLLYNPRRSLLYSSGMDVAVSTLRAELADWIERVRRGEEVVVTDRGTPVARLIAVDTAPLLERLTREGGLSRPRRAGRPTASGASRAHADRPVSELVNEERR